MVDGGTLLGSVSAPEAAAVFYLQFCSVQNAEAAQETEGAASPAIPPEVFANPFSSFSVCSCQRLLALFIHVTAQCHGFNYLFISLLSVMVSTGGGDSPLLICAGPCLLLVGHFSRGSNGAGLALLELGPAALGALLPKQALKKLLVVHPGAGVTDGEGLLCCTVCPCTLPGQGKAQFRLVWDRAQSTCWGGCRAGLPAGNEV